MPCSFPCKSIFGHRPTLEKQCQVIIIMICRRVRDRERETGSNISLPYGWWLIAHADYYRFNKWNDDWLVSLRIHAQQLQMTYAKHDMVIIMGKKRWQKKSAWAGDKVKARVRTSTSGRITKKKPGFQRIFWRSSVTITSKALKLNKDWL